MRVNFQSVIDETATNKRRVEPKPIRPRPIKDPNYAEIRKKIAHRFRKTLAYLAK